MEKINEIFWEEGYECMSIRFCEEILLKLSWDSFWNVVLNRVPCAIRQCSKSRTETRTQNTTQLQKYTRP